MADGRNAPELPVNDRGNNLTHLRRLCQNAGELSPMQWGLETISDEVSVPPRRSLGFWLPAEGRCR